MLILRERLREHIRQEYMIDQVDVLLTMAWRTKSTYFCLIKRNSVSRKRLIRSNGRIAKRMTVNRQHLYTRCRSEFFGVELPTDVTESLSEYYGILSICISFLPAA